VSDRGRSTIAGDYANHRAAGTWLGLARERGWLAGWRTLRGERLGIEQAARR
jgi:hypothetical protein